MPIGNKIGCKYNLKGRDLTMPGLFYSDLVFGNNHHCNFYKKLYVVYCIFMYTFINCIFFDVQVGVDDTLRVWR
jgi:hypothetical protein